MALRLVRTAFNGWYQMAPIVTDYFQKPRKPQLGAGASDFLARRHLQAPFFGAWCLGKKVSGGKHHSRHHFGEDDGGASGANAKTVCGAGRAVFAAISLKAPIWRPE